MAENAAIARPYSQAVFEIARDAGQLAGWSDALQAAALVAGNPQIIALVGSPATDKGKLVALIADIATQAGGAVDAGKFGNMLKLLAENGRLLALPDIAAAYEALKAETENRVDVLLTAASQVDEAQQAKIAAALKKRFGKDVSLTFKLDENLIGGARLQAADLIIDGSVSAGLAKLATSLAN